MCIPQAYAPQSSIWCVRCNETLPLLEVGDHLHVCPGERNEESRTTSSHEQAGGTFYIIVLSDILLHTIKLIQDNVEIAV